MESIATTYVGQESDLAFLERLEQFCQQGEFRQVFLQRLGDEHCIKFINCSEEQSLECHQIFQRYLEELDSQLEAFLVKERITGEEMFEKCQRAYKNKSESESLVCLNWILASTDYAKFVEMMLEFKVIIQGGKDYMEQGEAIRQKEELTQRSYVPAANQIRNEEVKSSGKPRVLITGINGYVGS